VASVGAKGKEGINKEVKRLWNATTVVEMGTIKGTTGIQRYKK